MKKIPKNQKGFTAIEVLLIILIFVIIAAVGYMVYHNDHESGVSNAVDKTTTSSSTQQATADSNVTWETYSNQQGGFTYQYPSNWTNSATEQPESYGSYSGVEGTVTAPDGSKLAWIFQYIGGKGGGCVSNAGDVAFAVGDNCASKQIISVQQLPTLNSTTNHYAKDLFEDGLYITETKYDPGSTTLQPLYPGMPTYAANSTSYQICLDPSYNTADSGNPPTVGTNMNLLFPCEFWDTGFNAIFPVKNASDFNSADAQTAVKIMKSFNTLQ